MSVPTAMVVRRSADLPSCTRRARALSSASGAAAWMSTWQGAALKPWGGTWLPLTTEPLCAVARRLNGDTRFEQAILAESSCAVHGYDGTLVGPRKALTARFPPEHNEATNATFTFHPINFDAQTWRQFASEHVSMLKIDCEGCGTRVPKSLSR